jgi:hypothetical protein
VKEIESEQNIEVLRGLLIYAVNAGNEYKRKYESIIAEQESKKQTSFELELMDQLQRLKKKFFGFGRETNPKHTQRPVGHDHQKLTTHCNRLQEELDLKS